MEVTMKKVTLILGIVCLLVALSLPVYAASPVACPQTLISYGPNMKELTFTCTATAGSFAATATSTANTAAIKGWYITEVRTTPGGTAPTAGTTVTLMSNDSVPIDILGGVATCSDTVTTRFVPKLNATSNIYGGASVRGALTHTVAGNAVATAIVITKYILWNN
jgi:hypothetical protein